MDFEEALRAMKAGDIVTRASWNGCAMVSVELNTLIYSDSYGSVEYLAPSEDLMALDWELL